MNVVSALRAVLGEGYPTAVYECRSCGTTLEEGAVACPYCGPTDVVRIEIR